MKLVTTFSDGVEMAEEYDHATDALLVRKWKTKSTLGGDRDWEYEIGEAPVRAGAGAGAGAGGAGLVIAESSANPVVVPRDIGAGWEWRIRNLPYPKDVYLLSIDDDKQQIVVRTSNKKYFKRIDVPMLRREGVPLHPMFLSFDHSMNTLVIQYEKPPAIRAVDAARREERLAKAATAKEGDVSSDCRTQ